MFALGFFFRNFEKCHAPDTKRRIKMGRMPRINIENALYYIISRGDHNQDIFADDKDYSSYIELLKKSKEEGAFKLFAYCLLPAEIRLLLELEGKAAVSEIMHGLNSTYTKLFNSRHGKKGHLFQERYKLVLAEKERYLTIASAHVHLMAAKMSAEGDYKSYPYSSYAAYSGANAPINIKEEAAEVKRSLAGAPYTDFVESVKGPKAEEFGRKLDKSAILGSTVFIDKIKALVETQKSQSKEIKGNKFINKRFLAVAASIVLLLTVSTLYLYGKAMSARERLKNEIAKKDVEMKKRLNAARAEISKDLDEKYRADMVSYQAMAKRLEIEKKKAKELEGKLKGTKALSNPL